MAIIKETSIGEDMEKENPYPLLVGVYANIAPVEITLSGFQKVELPCDPPIPLLVKYPDDSISHYRAI